MEQNRQWRRDEYLIDTDKSELNLAFTHAFLTTSSWRQAFLRRLCNFPSTTACVLASIITGNR
ncbi:Uncharacterised protein [Serratia plymuthica]|uniref:Uncharacterized protein n=1 Tax=Serratia plymuthica TaxID=82996 RepID=A0A2X4UEU5_SERPL|nr:Uncharacterised protein [Serratia plymuthica]